MNDLERLSEKVNESIVGARDVSLAIQEFLEEEGIDGAIALEYASRYSDFADFEHETEGQHSTTLTDIAFQTLISYLYMEYDLFLESQE